MEKRAGRVILAAGAILMGLLLCVACSMAGGIPGDKAKTADSRAGMTNDEAEIVEARIRIPGDRAETTEWQAVSGGTGQLWENRAERVPTGKERETEQKKIALTFDDGPHPYYTEQLLDGLRERGVKATFFVTGEHAKLHPEVIARMNEEGHLIGNHTYSHMQLSNKNRDAFREELIRTNEVIKEITGEDVLYVRPPYGTWDKNFETELNMFPVLWTVDPLDWCSSNVAGITSKVVDQVEENDIILMHDYYDSTVTAALNIIDQLQQQGYSFVTVEEILFD